MFIGVRSGVGGERCAGGQALPGVGQRPVGWSTLSRRGGRWSAPGFAGGGRGGWVATGVDRRHPRVGVIGRTGWGCRGGRGSVARSVVSHGRWSAPLKGGGSVSNRSLQRTAPFSRGP